MITDLKKRKSGKEKMNTVDTYVSEDFWHCNQVYKSKRREKPVKLHQLEQNDPSTGIAVLYSGHKAW